ncbi:Alpha/Beta hydrolase protein [Mycena maculata]|uniref:Alpha/Beta hydrolase protein n=1 Tax=Mycena maculata TaxID=230809 RepID=A0AAD7HKJ2_9AGAR|nr:Alpha/Beta hydrolase protein [Mycena maculata]
MKGKFFAVPVLASLLCTTSALEAPSASPSESVYDSTPLFSRLKTTVDQWYHDGVDFFRHYLLYNDGTTSSAVLETEKFRIVVPKLCERSVKQYSGYFNVAKDKHMFFWWVHDSSGHMRRYQTQNFIGRFFESRSSPSTDPLVLWLNGGPGDSSAVGLLFELGPCSIASEGRKTISNPHGWTNHANIIFLDQPADVGFSYADPGASVKGCAEAAQDVYFFLQLFFEQFPEYAKLPFHVAGESFGGIYGPQIASVIWRANQALAVSSNPTGLRINLDSVILANGITDPYIQVPSIVDYVCVGPYPLYDDPQGPECTKLRSNIPTCQRLIQICNVYPTEVTCGYASRFCRSRLFEPSMKSDLNWYDRRKKCNAADRPEHCYEQTPWVETWMNNPKVKAALGVDPERSFRSFNMDMNREFNMRGEGVKNAAKLLPELINGGVRLLVYAGKADMMANYMGNERWVENLDTEFKSQFLVAKGTPWSVPGTSEIAGQVRSAGGVDGSGGNITFVTVFEAGHMVAHDQPAVALYLFTRWITNVPLS